ncbi:MAG: 30S ribosomal protein S3 [Chloroflexi bacterium RBG_16_64_32]|nr:MAG: 30S ribosomal protein S3 [Chloroflexi bacterium RBG_16_64_32]
MGQKVHPHGFRLGYIYDWKAKWFAGRAYPQLLREDLTIRRTISDMLPDAGISSVEIERNANLVTVAVYTARPGIVIGRGGQRVDELRSALEAATGRKIRVNINEIRIPEIDAALVARAVADQIERRISHRRAIKQAISRSMQRGAQGIKIKVAGRLGGSDMSRRDGGMEGRVPLHTLKADIDYGTAEARTTLGRIGVKVWVYKGDRIPEVAASVKSRLASKERGAAAEPPSEGGQQPVKEAAEPVMSQAKGANKAEEDTEQQSRPKAEAEEDAAT